MAYSKRKMRACLPAFIKAYSRKRQKNLDPNDRHYDPELEEKLKRMSAWELAELIYGDN